MDWIKKYKFQLLLFALAFGLYSNTISHDYAWDDSIVITTNERVQKGFEGIPDLFLNYKSNATSDIYGYRPVTLLTFAIEVGFFGLNPHVSHFVNCLLYGILSILLFNFLLSFFKNRGLEFSLLIALLFIFHPAHTEVVANIKSRDEILAFIFGILALSQFLQGLERSQKERWQKLGLSLLFLILGFLSKESALVFIPLMGLFALFRYKIEKKQLIRYSLYLAMFFSFLAGLYIFSQSSLVLNDQSSQLLEKGEYLENGFLSNPLIEGNKYYLSQAVYLLGKYLKLFLVPHPLLHDYGFNQIPLVDGASFLLVFSFFFLIGTAVFLIITRKSKGPFKLGILFFLISIFGYLHLVWPGKDIFAERFLFVPSLGLCIAIIALISQSIEKAKSIRDKSGIKMAILIPVFLVFAILTFNRNKVWADNGTLLTADIPKLKNCVRANYNYASYLEFQLDQSPQAQQGELLSKAIAHYQQCIRITPRAYKAFVDLGQLYMRIGEKEKGLALFREASKNFSQLSEPYFLMGKFYLGESQYDSSLFYFKKARHNGWAKTENYYHIAISQIKLGNLEGAITALEEGEQYKPKYAEYYDVLGDLYLIKGDSSKAYLYSKKAYNRNAGNSNLFRKFQERAKWPK